MSAIQDAFKAQGVELTYQAAQKSKDGIVAPVLSFAYSAPAFPDNDYYQGPTHVTVSFGRASASASLTPVVDDFVAPALPSQDFPAAAPADVDAIAVDGALPNTAGFAGIPQFSQPTTQPAAAPAEMRSVTLANNAFTGPDGTNLYLAFLVIAGVGFSALTAWRVLGVRFPWGT
jgi:hypothetical protein